MNPIDILSIAADGVKERKFRFALNLMGILIGCAAVTGLISITDGLNDEVSGQLELFGPTNIMVIPGQIDRGSSFLSQKFYWRDVNTVEDITYVSYVAPIMGSKLAEYTKQGETRYASIFGSTPEYFWIFKNFKIESGRNLVRADAASVVLGAKIAHPDDEDAPIYKVGDRIKLTVTVSREKRDMTFRIVGILEAVGGTFGSEDDNSIIMPYRIFQQLYENPSEFDFIAVTVNDVKNVDKVVERIEDKLGESVTTMTSETIMETVGQVLGTIEAVLGGIAAISLLVAGVGIINTMMISVMERTREIGIMKAIGSKSRDVLLVFISEAVLTGFIGGILGGLLGFFLSQIVSNLINLPVTNSLNLLLGITIFAVITAVVSGLYPAWRASCLHPVEALRYE